MMALKETELAWQSGRLPEEEKKGRGELGVWEVAAWFLLGAQRPMRLDVGE